MPQSESRFAAARSRFAAVLKNGVKGNYERQTNRPTDQPTNIPTNRRTDRDRFVEENLHICHFKNVVSGIFYDDSIPSNFAMILTISDYVAPITDHFEA